MEKAYPNFIDKKIIGIPKTLKHYHWSVNSKNLYMQENVLLLPPESCILSSMMAGGSMAAIGLILTV